MIVVMLTVLYHLHASVKHMKVITFSAVLLLFLFMLNHFTVTELKDVTELLRLSFKACDILLLNLLL